MAVPVLPASTAEATVGSSVAGQDLRPGPDSPSGSGLVTGTARVKRGMADMLKGGVIMDVVTPDHAKIAEDAGAVAVMALERVPADIRAEGGVARMSDPDMIDGIIAAPSATRRSASPKPVAPHTNGTVNAHLST